MTTFDLLSPRESVPFVTGIFDGREGGEATLSVREDICFEKGWLDVGTVLLRPVPAGAGDEETERLPNAARYGSYEWHCRDLAGLVKDVKKLTGDASADEGKIKRALSSLPDVATRLGLLFPWFDPDALSLMPFRLPTTVVADTCAVIKGGVDFLARFLHPMARLKIPAIVAMEIANQVQTYLEQRRKSPQGKHMKVSPLLDHVTSQGGQRALLRFELHSDVEVERTRIFSDPLRNAFHRDNDYPNLNVVAPIRAYCDRLILETAREHRALVSPGHPVLLMTSDEGLARMAIAEGIEPLFFRPTEDSRCFGRILCGTPFRPFDGRPFSVPLCTLIWELAVTFGSARLASSDGSRTLSVQAMAKDLNWQPFHARDDLLRVCWEGYDPLPSPGAGAAPRDLKPGPGAEHPPRRVSPTAEPKRVVTQKSGKTDTLGPLSPGTVYDFSLDRMLRVLQVLADNRVVSLSAKDSPFSGMSKRTLREYVGFLRSAGLVEVVSGNLQATDLLFPLWHAARTLELAGVAEGLRAVPSFRAFLDSLPAIGQPCDLVALPPKQRPSPAYLRLAELSAQALRIPEEGIYSTPRDPEPRELVELALSAYDRLRKGETYVPTGLWLEALARESGVHPLNARNRLSEAQAAGLLDRFTEGSTPDTRFDSHSFTALEVADGIVAARTFHLYRGDFIIPGKASVSIRLVKRNQ
jgi:hypothetical protein